MDNPPRPHRIPFPSSAPKRPWFPFPSLSESSSQAAPVIFSFLYKVLILSASELFVKCFLDENSESSFVRFSLLGVFECGKS